MRDVIEEIKGLARNDIFFVDDNINADPVVSKELFKQLIPLKINWCGQASAETLHDEELLNLMKESGCVGILIGFESLNCDNLAAMNKRMNNSCDFYDSILKNLRNHGLAVYATFIFGYDNDNKDSFEDTLRFALRHKFFFCAFDLTIRNGAKTSSYYMSRTTIEKIETRAMIRYYCY